MGLNQSIQEVARVILEELVANPIDLKGLNYHKYFHDLKMKNPDKYEGLLFDTNWSPPYSEDLEGIFKDFKNCGFLYWDKNILSLNKKEIVDFLDKKEE